jgi:hypothetical protein
LSTNHQLSQHQQTGIIGARMRVSCFPQIQKLQPCASTFDAKNSATMRQQQ